MGAGGGGKRQEIPATPDLSVSRVPPLIRMSLHSASFSPLEPESLVPSGCELSWSDLERQAEETQLANTDFSWAWSLGSTEFSAILGKVPGSSPHQLSSLPRTITHWAALGPAACFRAGGILTALTASSPGCPDAGATPSHLD